MNKGERRVLVAEDDEAMAGLLKDALTTEMYEVTTVPNGKEALEFFNKESFPVVITDIEMPVMDGYELIMHLKEANDEPTIFVVTANNDVKFIIDVMKRGVYDYLIKPIDLADLLVKVKRAFEVYSLKRIQRIAEKEREIRLEHQLEWVQWRAKMQGSEGRIDKSLFHNMHISFSQGTGFGALITLLSIVASSATVAGDHYIISKEMMDLVKDNAKVAENAINTFSEIEWLITNPLPMEKISCHALYKILAEEMTRASLYKSINNQTLMLSDTKPIFATKFVNVNDKYFRQAVYELYINAMKFSEKNSDIYALYDVHEENVSISVINQPVKDEEGRRGIPMEYENLVFEPFYRMSKNVHESYKTFDYGLGLTIVDKIVEKHGGKVSGKNITDHLDVAKGPLNKVEFNVVMPLASEK